MHILEYAAMDRTIPRSVRIASLRSSNKLHAFHSAHKHLCLARRCVIKKGRRACIIHPNNSERLSCRKFRNGLAQVARITCATWIDVAEKPIG